MNRMVCSIELVLWIITAMASIALGLGFLTSGLVSLLSDPRSFLTPLGHQFFYALLAFILFRIAMLRVDKGWRLNLLYYALAALVLIAVRMILI